MTARFTGSESRNQAVKAFAAVGLEVGPWRFFCRHVGLLPRDQHQPGTALSWSLGVLSEVKNTNKEIKMVKAGILELSG